MSFKHHACTIIHHKKLTLYFTSKDNNIPDASTCKNFKDFHATRLYNRWAKTKIHNNFSNRLGISFTTSYHAYNIRKRQEARLNASIRHTFHNANLRVDAPMDDKLRAARCHTLLFQENQQFTKPIRHLHYKKKFIVPSKIVAPDDLKDVIGSVVSPTISDDILPPVLDNYDNVPAHYLLLILDKPFMKAAYIINLIPKELENII
ncbi:hypothetical protein RhiirA1_469759 [Rhizophagus irregularis]|uniref:DUF8211 domain-containing protein n=1 Tax=Rhizophagus irregularis TaxID=588596 RepID=A0A2N0R7E2_9GLOM|nr:hypothetical protein RhiirA1_469759 [Rhizophagus irregularis]